VGTNAPLMRKTGISVFFENGVSVEIGELIENKYRITRLIGEGGMGAVYLGENVRISRKVAIKVLHAGLTENKEVTQRFEREAQAAGRIGNDHILEVLDLGSLPNGDHYIVMEYLDGEALTSRIKTRGRMEPLELAQIIRQVLVGLSAAHRAGIIHRDLKPDNIFILKEKAGKKDFCKIIDFGISKFQPLNNDGMRMTRTGMMMGTPYYMSPEQASGSHEADHRADLYAVGVMMFEATTGQVPFDAATFNQLLFKIVLDDVPRPEALQPDLDPAFASLISKAMARDMNQRFQSSDDFIEAIDGWMQRGAPVTIPPSADAAAMSLLRQRPSAELTPEQKTGTGGSWATSQVDTVPKKSNKPLFIALGALLVAGTAGAVVALGSGKTEAENPAEAAHPPESAAAAALQPPASPPVAPVPPPAVEPVATAAPAASADVAATPSAAAPVAPAAVAARPRPAAARPPAGSKTPAPSPTPAATGTAKKRRDFGY
jgi:serine/threonine protein kinase